MICPHCKGGKHGACLALALASLNMPGLAGYAGTGDRTWCDCQHWPRHISAGEPEIAAVARSGVPPHNRGAVR